MFKGKKILITGGTGSLGQALTRKLLSLDVDTIRIFSRNEQKQIEMKLGQLLIFSSRLVHKSGINVSNQVRYSIVNMYHNLDNKN